MKDLLHRVRDAVKDNYPSPHIGLLGELLAEFDTRTEEHAEEVDHLVRGQW